MTDINGIWRTDPMYSFSEVARLSGVSPAVVRNWFLGYTTRDKRKVPPLFPHGVGQNSMVSFLQMIETVVAARFRTVDKVRYRNVHAAYHNAQEILQVEYPFAHRELEALGGHIIARLEGEKPGESLQSLNSTSQWSLPGLIIDTIRQIEHQDDFAAKWFPLGKAFHIVVDPQISSGVPTIAGRRVTVEAVRNRWKSGYKIGFIAQDLSLDADVVETVLQYGDKIAA